MLKDHNAVTPVRLEPATLPSRFKHSTTEPLRSLMSLYQMLTYLFEMHLTLNIKFLLDKEKLKKNANCVIRVKNNRFTCISYSRNNSGL